MPPGAAALFPEPPWAVAAPGVREPRPEAAQTEQRVAAAGARSADTREMLFVAKLHAEGVGKGVSDVYEKKRYVITRFSRGPVSSLLSSQFSGLGADRK